MKWLLVQFLALASQGNERLCELVDLGGGTLRAEFEIDRWTNAPDGQFEGVSVFEIFLDDDFFDQLIGQPSADGSPL